MLRTAEDKVKKSSKNHQLPRLVGERFIYTLVSDQQQLRGTLQCPVGAPPPQISSQSHNFIRTHKNFVCIIIIKCIWLQTMVLSRYNHYHVCHSIVPAMSFGSKRRQCCHSPPPIFTLNFID